MTFDVRASAYLAGKAGATTYELFSICRHCQKSTTFIGAQPDIVKALSLGLKPPEVYAGALDNVIPVVGYVSTLHEYEFEPPPDIPEQLERILEEGVVCLSVCAPNAAATMFRLCVDIASKNALPIEEVDGLTTKIRRNLGLRLDWLFSTGGLPASLKELSACIREDGNDGAHEGSLSMEDAEDLREFTYALLDRLYSEPTRIRRASQRRAARRLK